MRSSTPGALPVASADRDLRRQDRLGPSRERVAAIKRALFGARFETADPERSELSLADIGTALSVMQVSLAGNGWRRFWLKTKCKIRAAPPEPGKTQDRNLPGGGVGQH